MDHIKILKRAAQVVWKYRALWVIGLLLVLAGGSVMGGLNGSAPGSPGSGDGDGFYREWDHEGWRNWDDFWSDAGPVVVGMGAVLIAVVSVALVIGLVRVVLRYVTRTSLIRMVAQYETTGEED